MRKVNVMDKKIIFIKFMISTKEFDTNIYFDISQNVSSFIRKELIKSLCYLLNKKYVGIVIAIAIVISTIALSSSYIPSSKTTNDGQNVSNTIPNPTATPSHKIFTVDLNETVGMAAK